ncbi:MAG: hypothetical protein Q9187_001966 [Circinaria calcarea]
MYGLQTASDQDLSPEGVIDIIAVPGVSCDQENVWTPLRDSILGFAEFFSERSIRMRVSTYTYPLISEDAEIFSRKGISREAIRLLKAINGLKRKQRQKIVLIGHDIGGTLVKEVKNPATKIIRPADVFRPWFKLRSIFIGCPHINDYSINLDGSLNRLLYLNDELKFLPRKVSAACLGAAIQAINADFLDVGLQLTAAVYNISSNNEDLHKRVRQTSRCRSYFDVHADNQVFLSHESELQATSAPSQYQRMSSLSHLEMAFEISAEDLATFENLFNAPRWAEISKLRSFRSFLPYVSSYRTDDYAYSYKLRVLQETNIQQWTSTCTTPFLAIRNVENIRFASSNIRKFLLNSFNSSAFSISLLHQFDFRSWDCRYNTAETMLSTFLNQAFCDITEETFSACSWNLRNQFLGWSVDDLFKLYYHAFLTRSDADVVWILLGLDESFDFYSWLLEKLRTTATNCDLHFRVIFLNSNAQELGLDAEYTTTLDWTDPGPELEHGSLSADQEKATRTSANTNQQFMVSQSNEAGVREGQDGDRTPSSSLDIAESEALQVIQRNAGLSQLTFLGSKLVTFFHRTDFSYEHKKMVAIWLSNLQMNSKPTTFKTRLLESLDSSLEVTFRTILDFAIPGLWGSASATETLQLIALSFRPLTYCELGDLERACKEWKTHYTPRPTEAMAIMSWLPGIINLHNNETHFSHPGFRRFLFSGNVQSLQLSDEELSKTHSRLARLCLEYIVSSHGQRLLEAVPANVEDIAAPEPRMEFLSYAVKHWPKHAQLAGTEFPLEDNVVKRFITDKTMLDTWAKVYWVRSSSAVRPSLGWSSPFAIFAEYGLEAILKTLIETHKSTEWLTAQYLNAIITAARNGITSTVRLLFDLQSLDPENLDLVIQASLQSRNYETILFAVSKALEIPNPSTCFSVALPQALAIGQEGVALRILSHLSWNNVEKKRKKELLLAACTGGDTKAVNYLLEHFEGDIDENEIFEATLQACRNGHAIISSVLLSKLLVIEKAKANAKTDLTNGPHKATNGLEHEVDGPPTAYQFKNTDKDSFNYPGNFQQNLTGVSMINLQKTPAQTNTDSASEMLTDEAPSGSEYGKVILQNALNNGQYNVLQSVLEVLNKHNTYQSLAEALLHSSISLLRPKCFRVLLQAFGQTDSPGQGDVNLNRNELLIRATSSGNFSIVQDLLSSGTVLDDTTFPTILAQAQGTSNVSLRVIELLIDEGRKRVNEVVMTEGLTSLLAMAVERNDETVSRTLIQMGADVNKRNIKGTRTPLYHAAYSGYTKILEALLEANADMNIPEDDDDGWLPIQAACDNPDVLKLLLAAGADFNARSKVGKTPLYWASRWGYQESVAEILKYHSDLNYMIDDTTILFEAVDKGHEAIASMLLDAGTDPCHAATKSANALLLHRCITQGQVDLLRKLLLYNFDIEYKDGSGSTALNSLESARDIPALRLLIRRGAQVDTADNWGDTPLANAVRSGDVDLAKSLVSEGANINQSILYGGTPLFLACQSATLEMVKMLIKKGGDTKHVDQGTNGTIFQAACQNTTDAKSDLLSYLLENEMVDVQQTSSLWGSNLNTACLMTDPSIVDLLIKRGADVNVEDNIGRRPIHFALYRTLDHVKCLRDQGAELLVTDVMQRNALHFAVISGQLDIVKYVLDEQPGLAKERDCDEWTPLFWAVRECFIWDTQTSERAAIIEILKKNGADIMDRGEGLDRIWTPFKLAKYYGLADEIVKLVEPTDKQIAKSNYKIFWRESLSAKPQVAKRDVVHQKHLFTAENVPDDAASSVSGVSDVSNIDQSQFGGGDEEAEEEAIEVDDDDNSDSASHTAEITGLVPVE